MERDWQGDKKPCSRSRSKTIYQGQYESINHVVVGGRRIHENKKIILLISRIFSYGHFAGNTAREINKNTVLNRLLENIPSTLHISQITKNGCCQWRTKKKKSGKHNSHSRCPTQKSSFTIYEYLRKRE